MNEQFFCASCGDHLMWNSFLN